MSGASRRVRSAGTGCAGRSIVRSGRPATGPGGRGPRRNGGRTVFLGSERTVLGRRVPKGGGSGFARVTRSRPAAAAARAAGSDERRGQRVDRQHPFRDGSGLGSPSGDQVPGEHGRADPCGAVTEGLRCETRGRPQRHSNASPVAAEAPEGRAVSPPAVWNDRRRGRCVGKRNVERRRCESRIARRACSFGETASTALKRPSKRPRDSLRRICEPA